MQTKINSEPKPPLPEKINRAKNSLLRDLFSYWRRPYYNIKSSKKGRLRVFFDIFRLWSFSIVIIFGVGLLLALLIEKADYDLTQHSVVDLFISQPTYIILFLVFLWAPITEELTFRLGLKYSPYRAGFSVVMLLTIIFGMGLVFFSDYLNDLIDWIYLFSKFEIILAYIFAVLLFGFLLGWIIKKKANHAKVEKFYIKRFRFIFYFFAIFFASVHLFNFLNLGEIWYLAVILILPQLLLGLILGFIRMKYSMVWAMFFHFLHNAIISVPAILFSYISDDIIEAVADKNTDKLNSLPPGDSVLIFAASAFSFVVFIVVVFLFLGIIVEYFRSRKEHANV